MKWRRGRVLWVGGVALPVPRWGLLLLVLEILVVGHGVLVKLRESFFVVHVGLLCFGFQLFDPLLQGLLGFCSFKGGLDNCHAVLHLGHVFLQ